MNQAIDISLPHDLGRVEAKRRISGKLDRLLHYFPTGTGVTANWIGDRLDLKVDLLGQAVDAWVEVEENQVRCHADLPVLLSLFAGAIESEIGRKGQELLEDKTSND